MSDNLRVDTSGLELHKAEILSGDIIEALTEHAGPMVLKRSNELVPKRSGDLEKSGSVQAGRGGQNTIGIVYSSVYSRWVHEHVHFKHPFGGTSKFLETALTEKGKNAIEAAARSLL